MKQKIWLDIWDPRRQTAVELVLKQPLMSLFRLLQTKLYGFQKEHTAVDPEDSF